VSVGYGREDVVRDVTFDIMPGEFCALLGLNGSGKTTLIRAICGFIPISGGARYIDGVNLARMKARRRAKYISYVPQRLSSLRFVSVFDVVMLGYSARLGAFDIPSEEERGAALGIIDKVGISHLVNESFSGLSEGQKKLTILARALVQDTPLMLMDEPDSALDFLNRHKLMDRLLQLIRNEGKAALVSLHDPNLALEFCDRIILIRDGEIVADLPLPGTSLDDIKACLT